MDSIDTWFDRVLFSSKSSGRRVGVKYAESGLGTNNFEQQIPRLYLYGDSNKNAEHKLSFMGGRFIIQTCFIKF